MVWACATRRHRAAFGPAGGNRLPEYHHRDARRLCEGRNPPRRPRRPRRRDHPQAETGLPVIVGQKIQTPEMAERLLADGVADLVGMARALIADPDFADQGA
jgi:2,4-dienoyl-CoA reductase-like NADH-dependent reductase (Old Yellow Enzyme family)